MVGVGTPQSCGLRKTALEFVRQDEPTDAGALGTRECVLLARVMELVDVEVSKTSAARHAGSNPASGTRRPFSFLPTNNCGIRSACRRVVFRPAHMLGELI